MTKTVALVQARMSSRRLPGKVLADLGGVPMIDFMLQRVKQATKVDEAVVLTSEDPSDDQLVTFCKDNGIPVITGPLNDVLERYRIGAGKTEADIIIRLTGDCPLIDPNIIDRVVALRSAAQADYASNIDPPTYADGLDVECFTKELLERACREAHEPAHREHVTLWMREVANDVRKENLTAFLSSSDLRITVDYEDDLAIVRQIVEMLGERAASADTYDILRLFERHAGLRLDREHQRNEALNSKCHSSN